MGILAFTSVGTRQENKRSTRRRKHTHTKLLTMSFCEGQVHRPQMSASSLADRRQLEDESSVCSTPTVRPESRLDQSESSSSSAGGQRSRAAVLMYIELLYLKYDQGKPYSTTVS